VKYVFITPHPALSHKGRGDDVVGKPVAHLTSPIKGEEQKIRYSLNSRLSKCHWAGRELLKERLPRLPPQARYVTETLLAQIDALEGMKEVLLLTRRRDGSERPGSRDNRGLDTARAFRDGLLCALD